MVSYPLAGQAAFDRLGVDKGLPCRDRGSGTTFPTVDLRRGDAYYHTGLASLMVYTGAAWRQVSPTGTTAADRAAMSTNHGGALHYGFEVIEHDTGRQYVWDGATWQYVGGWGQPPTTAFPYTVNATDYNTANNVAQWQPARYWKAGGVVTVQGLMSLKVAIGNGGQSHIGAMPAGVRPGRNAFSAIIANSGGVNRLVRVDFHPDGAVHYVNNSGVTVDAGSWFYMDMSYIAEG